MAFKNVIPRLTIQSQYQCFTDEFIRAIEDLSGNSLHSIYMCGSIPKGLAVPYKSDADFTLVFHKSPDETMLLQLEELKTKFLSEYPYITKIDTPVCLVSEVFDNLYEWGFWIKIICICVYGQDLGENLPEYVPSQNLIQGLNNDTESTVSKMIDEYNNNPSVDAGQQLAKRLLRAMYTLTLDREESWVDDFGENCEITKKYFPKWTDSLTILINRVTGQEKKRDHFIEHSQKLFQFVLVQSCFSLSNIQVNQECIPLVSKWIFEEFFRSKIPDVDQMNLSQMLRYRKIDALPMTYVAKAGTECIGTISLFEHDLKECPDFRPWLGALYVDEKWRGCGAGVKLIEFIQKTAFNLGFETIYLRTENTGSYYQKLDWERLEQLVDEYGQNVTVYRKSYRG